MFGSRWGGLGTDGSQRFQAACGKCGGAGSCLAAQPPHHRKVFAGGLGAAGPHLERSHFRLDVVGVFSTAGVRQLSEDL